MGYTKSIAGFSVTVYLTVITTLACADVNKAAEKREHSDRQAGHRDDSWVSSPKDYVAQHWDGWQDEAAAERGKSLFRQQCASSHGDDGRGTGPAAKGLAYAPANLTTHFHRAPGDGDGYLFWRVSEGGTAEPFRSQDSAMPTFKSVLSTQERWDVLT